MQPMPVELPPEKLQGPPPEALVAYALIILGATIVWALAIYGAIRLIEG